VPATLPQLLRSNCLHAPLPLGSPLAIPTTLYSPTHDRPSPQHPSSSICSRRSQAPAHSAAARRCTQRTVELQRRQLRHPSETQCQRRCPIIFDPIACTHRRPSARPSQSPTTLYSPAHASAPARSTHHHQRTAGVRKHPLTAQLPADARSVQLRSSDVSCAILKRLGASDAAPASPM
jgi:hypothetical protein